VIRLRPRNGTQLAKSFIADRVKRLDRRQLPIIASRGWQVYLILLKLLLYVEHASSDTSRMQADFCSAAVLTGAGADPDISFGGP